MISENPHKPIIRDFGPTDHSVEFKKEKRTTWGRRILVGNSEAPRKKKRAEHVREMTVQVLELLNIECLWNQYLHDMDAI